jgi:alpha-L-rhamnosidase
MVDNITRIAVPPSSSHADSNIRPRYAIENAAWLWHPSANDPVALRFKNHFAITEPMNIRLHVSADERYELSLDGEVFSMGPDRGDLEHWSFASYELMLAAGTHTLEAVVWWLGPLSPLAQMSSRGGFICAAEGLEDKLNTGKGSWFVERITGWSFTRKRMPNYHVIGPSQTIAGSVPDNSELVETPTVVAFPIHTERNGGVQGIWRLHPSPLPDMLRQHKSPGTIRAVTELPLDVPLSVTACQSSEISVWQDLLTHDRPVVIPPNTTQQILWDLENYFCGYETITLSGGAGSRVAVEWAESLFHVDESGSILMNQKGHRTEVFGKRFLGFGDQFLPAGGPSETYRSHWWRSGRYVLLTLSTAQEPLRVEHLGIVETRYPCENSSVWDCSDASLNALIPLYVRAIQMCSHETFIDCPYYEQLMYVGDTRLQMLVTSVITGDDRLIRRGIELFDWSRSHTGFVRAHYPGRARQQILTFAILWPTLLHDFAWWHDDSAFVRARMIGMRAQFEELIALLTPESLLSHLAGWPFVDWVPEWDIGNPPDAEAGTSSIVNLLLVHSLQRAAALEEFFGEPEFAARYRKIADRVGRSILARFWCPAKQLIADDLKQAHFSEHAQCLALLTEILPLADRSAVFEQLLKHPSLSRATIYFSHYLFETFYQYGRGDLIIERLAIWKNLLSTGLYTTIEAPEPTRSDCHGWGAHPLFHYHSSLAGIRPAAPGYRQVRIAPAPGPLTELSSAVPTPHGEIRATFRFDQATGQCHAQITLPATIGGVFEWQGVRYPLAAGRCNSIQTRSTD